MHALLHMSAGHVYLQWYLMHACLPSDPVSDLDMIMSSECPGPKHLYALLWYTIPVGACKNDDGLPLKPDGYMKPRTTQQSTTLRQNIMVVPSQKCRVKLVAVCVPLAGTLDFGVVRSPARQGSGPGTRLISLPQYAVRSLRYIPAWNMQTRSSWYL